MSTAQVIKEAMRLPAPKRARLAEKLLESLGGPQSAEIDQAWGMEAEARIDAYDSGKLRSTPAKKVIQRLKQRKRG
jgi:putative addiction module component (TIGR02574 family)